ncbi:MAG: hypothetical protein WKG07_46635 [Hymenobacter sp.]
MPSVTDGAVGWPVHEVGRNADIFDDNAEAPAQGGIEHRLSVRASACRRPGRQVEAAVRLPLPSRGLQAGAPHHPAQPCQRARHRHQAGRSEPAAAHAYEVLSQPAKIVTFEPHLHAPGQRMCLEAIWALQHPDADLRRLRSQRWVRQCEEKP